MRRIPNFVLLRAFEAAARLQSFALASQELHLTPSAISHQVKELEEYFGRALFTRRNRRVEPTPEAVRLLESLSRVFDVVEAACSEVALAPQAQVLALHCAPSFAAKWLGPRLSLFTQAHPHITIRLTTGAEPLDLTRVHEIDVGVSYGSALERAGMQTVALGRERILPLCAPELLRGGVSARELIAGLTLIDSQLSRVTWNDWFGANGIELPDAPRPSFDRAAMAIAAAVDGMGVVLESARLAAREIGRGELVELGRGEFPAIQRETHFLSCRSNEIQRPKVQAFISWLLSIAGQDTESLSTTQPTL
ncbi:LysR substrate-binding domain-containing protein [Achromobacter sp. NPDC058515]|uniref:LysR substrate-binding domain-containing protein n=1 Tax=Achromobacter sp. NPDC058515 TaxID=3346533 RepID=UPI00364AD08C